jgi:hypothetical protein
MGCNIIGIIAKNAVLAEKELQRFGACVRAERKRVAGASPNDESSFLERAKARWGGPQRRVNG